MDKPNANELVTAIREHLEGGRPTSIKVYVEDYEPDSQTLGTLVLEQSLGDEVDEVLKEACERVREGFASDAILGDRLGSVTVGQARLRYGADNRQNVRRLEAGLRVRA